MMKQAGILTLNKHGYTEDLRGAFTRERADYYRYAADHAIEEPRGVQKVIPQANRSFSGIFVPADG